MSKTGNILKSVSMPIVVGGVALLAAWKLGLFDSTGIITPPDVHNGKLVVTCWADQRRISKGQWWSENGRVKITVQISNNSNENWTGNIAASCIAESGNAWQDMTVLSWFGDVWSGVTSQQINLKPGEVTRVRFGLSMSEFAETGYWGVYINHGVDTWKEKVFIVE